MLGKEAIDKSYLFDLWPSSTSLHPSCTERREFLIGPQDCEVEPGSALKRSIPKY
jgi:hypothetical protein